MQDTILNIYKVLGLGGFAFFAGIALTPILTHYLYKYKLWRKDVRTIAADGAPSPIFNRLDTPRAGRSPRLGGVLNLATTIFVGLIFRARPAFSQ